ncbi:hypothetical protein H5410_059424 [Solanum commersonii]|uniref:Transferrin receptor-like dimerisation domain-containing protein n=1 Tax=Solanum commersonii TaxID=4109 RepID=A0A9J5W2H4_SOLCO|nr:hypothetical protein H5410_059424 [Solanum commersonii]
MPCYLVTNHCSCSMQIPCFSSWIDLVLLLFLQWQAYGVWLLFDLQMMKFCLLITYRTRMSSRYCSIVSLATNEMSLMFSIFVKQKSAEHLEAEISDKGISLVPLYSSIQKLRKATSRIKDDIKALKTKRSRASVRELNDRLIMTERAFTDRDGLSSRTWYKHLIYAPAKHDDYGSNSFPGISDAIENAKSLNSSDSWHSVQHEVWRVARAITQASLVLSGRLT